MITIRGIALAALVALAACSSGTSRESARDQATTLTCQQFAACMEIGTGKTYPTQSDCEIQWQGNWDKAWPAADCEGKIDQGAFETCLARIRGTTCNAFDLLATLAVCSKANVCHATNADGG
jgi:hypothetical protein